MERKVCAIGGQPEWIWVEDEVYAPSEQLALRKFGKSSIAPDGYRPVRILARYETLTDFASDTKIGVFFTDIRVEYRNQAGATTTSTTTADV
jgi:hypothetical protein